MITLDTANQLDALALSIFDPQITPSPNPVLGDHWGPGAGLTRQDDATDNKLAALITEVMQTIDGRTLATGFKYTLNITNALQLRPKRWYMNIVEHDSLGYGWPAFCSLEFHSAPGFVNEGVNSFGGTIGLSTCAAICHAWAKIIRMWLGGNYPLAVNQP